MPKGRRRGNQDVLLTSAEMVGWALGGIEREIVETKGRLAALTVQAARLRKRLGRRVAAAVVVAGAAADAARAPRRRNLTPEGRKRISERMTKRWAEWRKKHKKDAK